MGTCPQIKYFMFTVDFMVGRKLSIMFTEPPVRKDIDEIMRSQWHKWTESQQDQCWEAILIIDFVPLVPWIGTINTFYGTITVMEKWVIDNRGSYGTA